MPADSLSPPGRTHRLTTPAVDGGPAAEAKSGTAGGGRAQTAVAPQPPDGFAPPTPAGAVALRTPEPPPSRSASAVVGLNERGGRLSALPVQLPVSNGAGYPFSPECFAIRVREADGSWTSYPGKLAGIYYGFTPKSKAEYEQNNDVPWFNAKGEAVAAGLLRPYIHHDGGYKGSYVMDPLTAEVPPGMNLVFKLVLDKFAGQCFSDNDTQHLGSTETKTYFVDATGA